MRASVRLCAWQLAVTSSLRDNRATLENEPQANVPYRPHRFVARHADVRFWFWRMLQAGEEKRAAGAHQDRRRAGISEPGAALQNRAWLYRSCHERADSPRPRPAGADRARGRRRGDRWIRQGLRLFTHVPE